MNGVLIASLYAPNGNPQPGPKFDYKLAWHRAAATRTRRSCSAAGRAGGAGRRLQRRARAARHLPDDAPTTTTRWCSRRAARAYAAAARRRAGPTRSAALHPGGDASTPSGTTAEPLAARRRPAARPPAAQPGAGAAAARRRASTATVRGADERQRPRAGDGHARRRAAGRARRVTPPLRSSAFGPPLLALPMRPASAAARRGRGWRRDVSEFAPWTIQTCSRVFPAPPPPPSRPPPAASCGSGPAGGRPAASSGRRGRSSPPRSASRPTRTSRRACRTAARWRSSLPGAIPRPTWRCCAAIPGRSRKGSRRRRRPRGRWCSRSGAAATGRWRRSGWSPRRGRPGPAPPAGGSTRGSGCPSSCRMRWRAGPWSTRRAGCSGSPSPTRGGGGW